MLSRTRMQIIGLAVLSIVLARIQFSVGSFPLPVTLFLIPGAMVLMLWSKQLRVDPIALLLVLAICANGCISFLYNQSGSLPSLLLIVYLYAITIFVADIDPLGKQRFDHGVVTTGVVLAALGIAQFALQWAIPADYLFSWKRFLPPHVLVEYNSLNELFYQAGIFKSNGFFFLESSQFGIFTARILALCVAMGGGASAVVLAAATLASYSGTAWLTFLIFFVIFIGSALVGRAVISRKLVVLLGIALVATIAAAPMLQLDRYLSRVEEVRQGSVQSSGGQRFNVPAELTARFLKESPAPNLLFGLGPGNVDSYFGISSYAVVASPWSKLIIEYGLAGFILFTALLYRVISRATGSMALRLSIVISFIFIDPGLLLASSVYPLYLLFGCVAVKRWHHHGGQPIWKGSRAPRRNAW